jgi:hypothetical protein
MAFLALMALAQASPSVSVPVRVEFEAPAGCADAEAFVAGVLARTSHVHHARPGENAVRLAVHLTRVNGRVHGELRVTVAGGESETRRVEGTSCAEVVQVLALTAALAIDPAADLRPPAPPERTGPNPAPVRSPAAASPPGPVGSPESPAPGAEPPAPAAPPAPTPEAPRPPPEQPPPSPPPPVAVPPEPEATVVAPPRTVPRPPTGPRVGASVVAARLLSSSMALGASVSGRYATATAGGLTPSASVAFIYLPGNFFASGDDLGVRWAALAATLCPGWGLGDHLQVEPCGRVTAGMLSVTDRSVSNPLTADRWWGSAGALLRASAVLGWGLSLDIEAGVDFPFITRRFITTTTVPNQVVGATASVCPAVSVGLSRGL